MTCLDWSAPAELYLSAATLGPRRSRYLRFPSAAEAIRYAIEELPGAALRAAAIESGDERHEGDAIRVLYFDADYPLRRQAG